MQKDALSRNPGVSNAPTVDIYDGQTLLGPATVTGESWSFETREPLGLGAHTLIARSGTYASDPRTLTVIEPDPVFDPVHPTVKEAAPVVGETDKQLLIYYQERTENGVTTFFRDDIHVEVPNYGMTPGETVKVYWKSANITLGSKVERVGDTPGPMSFVITKYEVADAINFDVDIWYTVLRLNAPNPIESKHLTLLVRVVPPNNLIVARPRLSTLGSPPERYTVLVVERQQGFNDTTTAAVRCIAGDDDSDTWSSEPLMFGKEAALTFAIGKEWQERNLGKKVKFNSSIRRNPSDGTKYFYSSLLRIAELRPPSML